MDSETFRLLSQWIGPLSLLWPVALTLVVFWIRRAQIERAVPFIVFGVLSCFGVAAIIGYFIHSAPFPVDTTQTLEVQGAQVFMWALWSVAAVAIFLSIPILFVLSRFFGSPKL
jgi:hypothetical protein